MNKKSKLNLKYIYESYFLENKYSKETSSFWRKYGDFQKVETNSEDYKLKGVMFGDFEERSFFNIVKNIPTIIYLKKLLKNCNKDLVNNIYWVAKKSGRRFSYDCARQALTINKLRQTLGNIDSKVFCIIGDGYGFLGSMIKKTFPKTRVIYINLGRTLFFDLYYSQKIFPNLKHNIIKNSKDKFSKDVNYIEAEKINLLNIKADIFINIVSMQEMDYEVINSYFDIFRNQINETWFYCCNRKSKTLPDGKIINFDRYPWSSSDEILFEELCPWHQEFPQNRPPFIHKFAPHVHKLIKVSQN